MATHTQQIPRQRGAQVPLSKPQKAHLSRLAKEAWTMLDRAGAIDEKADDWRRDQAISACGRRISEAVNGDFETLQAHFLGMAGKTDRAFQSAMRADSNDVRQARHKLDTFCRQHGLQPEYPAKIMRDKFKTTLDDASAKQLWAVFFDCKRNKGRKAPAEGQPLDTTDIPF